MHKILFSLAITLLAAGFTGAQCPDVNSLSASVTAADCPSSGTISFLPKPADGSGTTYRIISGPTGGGYQTTEQTGNIFSGLPAGTYQILVKCGDNSKTFDATVANNYTPITSSVAVTGVCSNQTPGGTITVTASGGRGTLRYAFLQSTDANAPDDQFTYGSSNTFTASNFGTYQVRVKDDCNNFDTKTVALAATEPAISLFLVGPANFTCSTISQGFQFRNDANQLINTSGKNYKLELWNNTATATCTAPPAGTQPTSTTTTTGSNITIQVNTGVRSVAWRITSPCGEVREGCWNNIPQQPDFFIQEGVGKVHGCPTGKNYYALVPSIVTYPISYTVQAQDANGNNIGSPVSATYNTLAEADAALWRVEVPYAAKYVVVATNGCGQQTQHTYTRPTTAPAVSVSARNAASCPNTSPVNATVRITGYAPNLTTIPLSNIVLRNVNTGDTYTPTSVSENRNTGDILFTSVPAGTYTVSLDVPAADGNCDFTGSSTFKIDPVNIVTHTLTLGGTANQQCGGTGTITAKATGSITTTTHAITFSLRRKGQTAVLASNTTGIFPNLAPGDYTVTATTTYSRCGTETLTSSRDFTITPDGSGPQIVKKLGIVCDNGTTGIASLLLAGASPYKVYMKKSTEPVESFVLQTDNAGAEYVKTGLDVNTIYDFQIIDNCGKATTTQVSLQPIASIIKLTTVNPCNNENYTLAVEEIAGATYEWVHNGTVVGNGSRLEFTPYKTAYDGDYTVTVKIGNCVTRTVTYTTNSNACNQPLSVFFGPITAILKDGVLTVFWTSLSEENNLLYEIEISKDGKNFHKIGSQPSKAKDGNSADEIKYSFSISAEKGIAALLGIGVLGLLSLAKISRRKKMLMILATVAVIMGSAYSCNKKTADVLGAADGKNLYIRIAVIDKDGVKSYSPVQKVVQE